MIAVVGLNTAVDRLIDVDTLTPGCVIRAHTAHAWPGGKGVHAALCVATLDQAVRLVGFVDGPHRDLFSEWLHVRGVNFHPIEMPGALRICVALRETDGRVTEILEPGPPIDAELTRTAAGEVLRSAADADVVVLSGSVPAGMPPQFYSEIVSRLAPRRVLVDASGELLRHAVEAAPFCVKPNRLEAEALTGLAMDSPAEAARAARMLQACGAHLSVISLGAAGAVAAWDSQVVHVRPPQVTALNAVGAGDCLIGGIAVGVARGDTVVDALRLGVAAGTAKVLSAETGVVRRADIDRIVPTIDVLDA